MSAQADWSIGFRGHVHRGWSNWKKPWKWAALCLPGPMTHGGFEQGWCLGPLGPQQPEEALVKVGLRLEPQQACQGLSRLGRLWLER